MMGLLMGSAVAVACIVVIARAVARGARRAVASPRRLFRSLCQAHRLTWSDRRLLRQHARVHDMADANQLFIDPRWLDQERVRGPLLADAARIAELRQRLFGR